MDYLSMHGLRVFRTVMETGTFAAAAAKMNISQPAVSGHIRRIEEYLGITLFETPFGRRLKPTSAGELLYEYAIEITVRNDDFINLLTNDSRGERGRLRVASSSSRTAVTSLLGMFSRQYPNIQIIARGIDSMSGKELLKKGEIDLGLFLYSDDPKLQCSPIFEEPLEIICSSEHPLTKRDQVTAEDLRNQRFITFIQGSEYNRLLYAFLSASDIEYRESNIQVDNSGSIVQVVEQGDDLGLVSRSTLDQSFRLGKIACLKPSPALQVPYVRTFLFLRNYYILPAAGHLFLQFLSINMQKHFPYFIIHPIENDERFLKLKKAVSLANP